MTLASGGERVNVFASVTYLKQEGLIQNNSFEKYDIDFNLAMEFPLYIKPETGVIKAMVELE